ncbi:lysophospholipid acyltransferase family protein [Aequorivita echinoideorum]|uniref:1-acyl-sn-glycerol-3-phosphate acyltransferase n=1 Tax=Aequorivita echinoideorum TaxID=1549647 RepID=A0ABS5S4G3_9FLAO|nr:lysophospholipid acyltransferase family protein [Aequorivita echinoideorum]MBT0607257.1 1-acyl-sn-glycerol-3-phosphate acyltransferase [Aequorivita echinoideorum]
MNVLLKIISYPFSALFYLLFGITIVVFHPIQSICFRAFGYEAHKKSVDYLNWVLLRCLNVLGTTFHVKINTNIPNDLPLVIVSNHQSMWDIPPITWYLRKYHPKFISKVELGKGIPSISYNLKHGGSVLIDRKNPRQAIVELVKFSKYLQKFKRSGVIFPEGTRSKTGVPKPFRRSGLQTLFKKIPDGYVVPVTINNSWKLQRWGMFPVQMGVRLEMIAHPAIKISEFEIEALIDKVEETITSKIHR